MSLGVGMAERDMHDTTRSTQAARNHASAHFFRCHGAGDRLWWRRARGKLPALLSGMPRCDVSLLHPHIAVGSVAGQPGKTIVYVDGVMACVDDSSRRVDQILTQLEVKTPASWLANPAPDACFARETAAGPRVLFAPAVSF